MSSSSVTAVALPPTTKYQLTAITEDPRQTGVLRFDGHELPCTRPTVPALVARHCVDSVWVGDDRV